MISPLPSTLSRLDGRSHDALRPIDIELRPQRFPEGSLVYRCGGTKLLIAASVEATVPDFLRGTGRGWVTAEYAMHPRANPQRQGRDSRKGRIDGRVQEIQRLIGRALRAAVALDRLGEVTITVDCDVLDADGGTRTAAVSGGFVALAMALDAQRRRIALPRGVLQEPVAAVSAGLLDGKARLDLCYEEDSRAAVDLNVVATASGSIVEVQGTAEGQAVPRSALDALIDLSLAGIPTIVAAQHAALRAAGIDLSGLLQR